jgi:hypothetical protein
VAGSGITAKLTDFDQISLRCLQISQTLTASLWVQPVQRSNDPVPTGSGVQRAGWNPGSGTQRERLLNGSFMTAARNGQPDAAVLLLLGLVSIWECFR